MLGNLKFWYLNRYVLLTVLAFEQFNPTTTDLATSFKYFWQTTLFYIHSLLIAMRSLYFFLYSASYTYRSLLEIDELPDIAKPIRYLCVCSKRKNQWLKFIHQCNWEERGTGAVCYIWNNLNYNIRNTLSKLWI